MIDRKQELEFYKKELFSPHKSEAKYKQALFCFIFYLLTDVTPPGRYPKFRNHQIFHIPQVLPMQQKKYSAAFS